MPIGAGIYVGCRYRARKWRTAEDKWSMQGLASRESACATPFLPEDVVLCLCGQAAAIPGQLCGTRPRQQTAWRRQGRCRRRQSTWQHVSRRPCPSHPTRPPQTQPPCRPPRQAAAHLPRRAALRPPCCCLARRGLPCHGTPGVRPQRHWRRALRPCPMVLPTSPGRRRPSPRPPQRRSLVWRSTTGQPGSCTRCAAPRSSGRRTQRQYGSSRASRCPCR